MRRDACIRFTKLQLHAVLRAGGAGGGMEGNFSLKLSQTPCFIGEGKGLLSKTQDYSHLEPTVPRLLSSFPSRPPVFVCLFVSVLRSRSTPHNPVLEGLLTAGETGAPWRGAWVLTILPESLVPILKKDAQLPLQVDTQTAQEG